MKKIIAALLIATAVCTPVQAKETMLSDEIKQICVDVGREYCLPPELLMAIAERESGGDPNATGDNGKAIGLCQIHACYQQDRMAKLGFKSLYDPKANITVAAEIISEHLDKYKDPRRALMAYNGQSDADYRAAVRIYSDYANWVQDRMYELQGE